MARTDLEGQVGGGGGYNNFEFTVTDAWFGPSEAFTAKTKINAIFLHWVGTTTLEGVPSLDVEDFHPSYMIGDDYELVDGGKAIKWIGNPAAPPKSRDIKKWYGRVLNEWRDNEEMKALVSPNHPFDGPEDMHLIAATFIGTKWFMQNVFYEFSKDSPNMSDATHLMPVRFLGKVDVAAVTTTAVPAGVPAPATTAAVPTPAPTAVDNNGLREQVTSLAALLDDYATWQAAALKVDGVTSDIPLVTEIADQSESGLYARARA